MAGSPASWRHRSLTRSDSLRLPASRGVFGLTYVFVFASGLFMLFLVLYQLGNVFQPSQRYNLSKVYTHVYTNSSFSSAPNTTNGTTTNETSLAPVSSLVNASVSSKDGAEKDHGVQNSSSSSQSSTKEGSGPTPNDINQKTDFSQNAANPPENNRTKPDDGVGRKQSSGLTPNHGDQNSQNAANPPNDDRTKPGDGVGRKEDSGLTPDQSDHNSQNAANPPNGDRTKPDDGVGRKESSWLTPDHQSDQNSQNAANPPADRTKPPQKRPLTSPKARKGSQNVKRGQRGKHLRKKKKKKCDLFEGSWVRDDSYPLYKAGTCPHIDEPFNCFANGRSENFYEKFRWQPKHCNLPRLNASNMLEILRGKRLVFIGDSLNRNMWESLVCILGNSVEDKSRMFEASGREEFRTEDSYSFIFKDYNCSIEFFRSVFLVQEWEMPDQKGSTKETLRLDLVERSGDKYKNADVVIFNTGHWWTHEKRIEGKEYYQEGDHIHGQLNVEEAFHKALLTWAKWVDNNVDPKKTTVVFRGYSPSHFMGGEWNSGGQCENETEPMKNESNLSENPPMMRTIESVVKNMKTPVFYLNITKMTDLRHDAHPSLYREMNMTEEKKKYMLKNQDCSHWCLPGVPDLWNELVYAHLLHRMKKTRATPKNNF